MPDELLMMAMQIVIGTDSHNKSQKHSLSCSCKYGYFFTFFQFIFLNTQAFWKTKNKALESFSILLLMKSDAQISLLKQI